MTIIEKYLQEVVPLVISKGGADACSKPRKGGLELPCPFCCTFQETERKRKKRVGMFFPKGKNYSYHFFCVRCEESLNFDDFLMKFDSGLFNKYQMERFHAGTTGKGHTLANPKFKINKPKFEK